MIHDAYQNGGEYQPLPFDQWAIEQMLQSKNPVHAWKKDDGTVSYGFITIFAFDESQLDWGAKDIREAQEIWRENMKEDLNDPAIFRTTINGREITTPRWNIKTMVDLKAINLGYMDMPGYPNTLILIAGAFDENGNWYLQPFVVNHAPISVGEEKTAYPTKFNYPGLFLTLDDYRNRLSEVSLDQPNELFQLIGNQLTLEGASSVVIMMGKR
jgi:hypothetical protein